jgi:addiction module HigA family antidote
MAMALMHNPPHPGEVLRDWLEGHTATEAAGKLGVSRVTLSRILNGAAGVSAEMDLRLSQALGTTPGLWLKMQGEYDLVLAKRSFRGKVSKIVPRKAKAA